MQNASFGRGLIAASLVFSASAACACENNRPGNHSKPYRQERPSDGYNCTANPRVPPISPSAESIPIVAKDEATKAANYQGQDSAPQKVTDQSKDSGVWAYLWRSWSEFKIDWNLVATWISAIATGWAAIAASKAAASAAASNKISRETAEYELRAYVSVKPISVTLRDGAVLKAEFIIKNDGQTPAHKLRYVAGLERMPSVLSDTQGDLALPEPGARVPAQPVHPSSEIRGEGISETIVTADGIVEILNGVGDPLCLFGKVEYEDIFGVPRQTRFCAYADALLLRMAYGAAQEKAKERIDGVRIRAVSKTTLIIGEFWVFAHVHNDAT